MVYIREAHPSDAWQLAINEEESVVFASPKSFEERSGAAEMCVLKLGIEFPAVIDGLDNSTEEAYTGWPDRFYVIDRDGRIALKSAPGPFGFKPEDVAKALQRLVPTSGP